MAFLMSALAIVAVILFLGILAMMKKNAAASDRMEKRLDTLAATNGKSTGFEASDEVRRLAKAGNYVAALRQYRADTGADLEYAKRVVDALPR